MRTTHHRWAILLAIAALITVGCSDDRATVTSAATTATTAAATTVGVTTTAATTTSPSTPTSALAPSPDHPELVGLDFADFLEVSYAKLLVRSPQQLTSLGVAANHGMRNDRLDDLSPEYLAETQALEVAILERLRGYDRGSLSTADRRSYDVYEWYLDQQVRGHRFAYHDYPVHYFVNSYNTNLVLFLSEEHPLDTLEDVEDFLARVARIDDQVEQLLERLRISEDLGVIPPSVIVDWTIGALRQDLGGARTEADLVPAQFPLYHAFVDRLDAIPTIDDAIRAELLTRAEAELAASFGRAWLALISHLEDVRLIAGTDAGVWRLPDGDAYYEWLLRDHTSTDLTAGQIHQIGLDEVARIETELRAAFDRLGYPTTLTLGELQRRAATDAGYLDGRSVAGAGDVIDAYERLIAEAEARTRDVFNLWPVTSVRIVPESAGQGGFYVAASVDGTRPGAFHAGVGGRVSLLTMPTITFHEAVPGHHTQIAIAQELELPTFRRYIQYNGFAEGWALYAERLAAELGLYADDPYGDIGRLELELLRAVRLVVDTGIHALEWSREEARAYMDATIPRWGHEVERYVVLPGQATGYMIGMLAIIDLRNQAIGDDLSELTAFHDLVLGGGSLPLEVLEDVVAAQLGGN